MNRVRVVGYVRVSTREQADSRLGLDAQRRALVAEAERRDWDLTVIEDAGFTGRNDNRPGLQRALLLLKQHKADVLMVYKLDRISRSVQDFAGMLGVAQRQRWALVALDMQVDMTTPNGRLVAHILVAVAQWESEMIGARTADAMAEAKTKGSRFGRARMASQSAADLIVDLRSQGLSFDRIAARLDAAEVPTPNNARQWYGATVSRLHKAVVAGSAA